MKITFKCLIILMVSLNAAAQVGIGTTTPNAALEVTSTNDGLLIPRVALVNTATATVTTPTASEMVYNTATINDVTPGFYYWSGMAWIRLSTGSNTAWNLTGNTGTNGGNTVTAGTNFIGTIDNQNFDIRTNNTFIARFSALGEFFLNTLNTTIAGDLMNSVGKNTFPFAVNGYTSFNGTAVYGLRSNSAGGTWGSVQGETDATIAANNSCIAGLAAATSHRGVLGQKPAGGLGFGGLFLNDLGYSGGVFNVSDRRLKKNIKPLTGALETIQNIPLYTYNFKTEDYDVLGGDELHFGVMSDELMQIVPSLVKAKSYESGTVRNPDGKPLRGVDFAVNAVNYMELIPIALQGIKEQQAIIEKQTAQIASQNERIAKLEKIISELHEKK